MTFRLSGEILGLQNACDDTTHWDLAPGFRRLPYDRVRQWEATGGAPIRWNRSALPGRAAKGSLSIRPLGEPAF